MELKVIEIEPTELEFGAEGKFLDPKSGLRELGPFDLRFGGAQLNEVKIGIVGTPEMVAKAVNWINRCQGFISSTMKNTKQYPDYDGFEKIFRCKLKNSSIWNVEIDDNDLKTALSNTDKYKLFEDVLELHAKAIEKIANLENNKPNVVICALSEIILEACRNVEKKLTKEERRLAKQFIASQKVGFQYSIFDAPIQDTGEDLLYRDFRRALKAKAIVSRMPIQIGRDSLFTDLDTNQDAATRAWNSSVALYYKAGGIPWRLKNSGIETCYIGITFHHLRTTKRAIVKSCLAQGFSSEGEGFALRGGDVEEKPGADKWDRTPHLSLTQSKELGLKILKEYSDRTGINPQRIVLHKTSQFNEDEEQGFREAFRSIPIVELINLLPTSFMLLKHSNYPVNRGTLAIVNDSQAYFFNSGFIKAIGTYPGPHIPRPIEIRSNEPIDLIKASEDILALARMNWNTSSITGSQPVTIFFSRLIGGIMSELNVKNIENVPTSFRYYI
jgi:hypothetical protein